VNSPAKTSAWLVDERWAKAYPLREDVSIGRGSENTIILRDPAVSRLHAEVKRDAGRYVLHAHGSSGTKVNGVRVGAECDLHEDDVIEIAFSKLRFTTKAPTSEMFVIRRDAPTAGDEQDVPTRMTLHALDPITLVSRFRRIVRWLTDRLKTD
jgi:pSer/pThr/pTyr-binding forkhead associated (FHA) protein